MLAFYPFLKCLCYRRTQK